MKWDMNRNITDNGRIGFTEGRGACPPNLGVYELMDRLTKAYPDVFEAVGGGRFDFGILTTCPKSDKRRFDAIERLRIQYGTSYDPRPWSRTYLLVLTTRPTGHPV